MTEETQNEKLDLKSLKAELEASAKEPAKEKQGEDISDEKIQELSEKITKKEVKEEVKEVKKKKNVDGKAETLIPLEDYIKCAVHLGTKVITPHMRKFVYKRRADGLAVINTAAIDEKLREAVDFLVKYDVKEIVLVCKREASWQAAEKFAEQTGIRAFTKKYPPGIITNLELEDFFEPETIIICDPWTDKNALNDMAKLKKPILSLCDTNNFTTNVTNLIPCNNKAKKSVGCILYILAREFCKRKDLKFNAELEDFTGKLEDARDI